MVIPPFQITYYFCFPSAVWASTSGDFCIISDTLVLLWLMWKQYNSRFLASILQREICHNFPYHSPGGSSDSRARCVAPRATVIVSCANKQTERVIYLFIKHVSFEFCYLLLYSTTWQALDILSCTTVFIKWLQKSIISSESKLRLHLELLALRLKIQLPKSNFK